MRMTHKRREAIAAADRKAEQALTMQWQSAYELSRRVGWSLRSAAWALWRLKKRGGVEVRVLTRKDPRMNRQVLEYRSPGAEVSVIDNWALRLWGIAYCPGCGESSAHAPDCPLQ
jgi:hypothetical protein